MAYCMTCNVLVSSPTKKDHPPDRCRVSYLPEYLPEQEVVPVDREPRKQRMNPQALAS